MYCFQINGLIDVCVSLMNMTFIITSIRMMLFVICASPLMIKDLVMYWLNERIVSIKYSTHLPYCLDIYCNDTINTSSKSKPVIVYLVGGTWMFATKRYGLVVGKYMQKKNVLLVVPDVGNYPCTSIHEMIENTQTCLQWVINNVQQYGGDPSNITIVGHSSGAFIGYHMILRSPQYIQNCIVSYVGIGGPYCLDTLKITCGQFGIEVLYEYFFPSPSTHYNYDKTFSKPINFFFVHNIYDNIIDNHHIDFVINDLSLANDLPLANDQVNWYTMLYFPTKHTQLMVEDLLFGNFHFLDIMYTITTMDDILDGMHEIIVDEMFYKESYTNMLNNKWYSLLVYLNPI